MVVPGFDLMRMAYGVAPCPTCNDTRMVFMTTSTVQSPSDEEYCRRKLYGEYETPTSEGGRVQHG